MFARLPEFDGVTEKGYFGNPDVTYEKAVGAFARGATGRVCLVLVQELTEGMQISTLDEIEKWAESVPGGYLEY